MTAITGQAASSGHITLLFSVQDDDVNLINQGSRGIGLCIDPDEPTCQITVTGKHGSGKISEQSQNENLVLQQTVINTLSQLVPSVLEYDWLIQQTCGLPQQQGFGLSAAGALATALALQRALGEEEQLAHSQSFHVAHVVERKLSGGLGDVAALWAGGVDLRREPGCPQVSEKLGGSGVVEGWHTNLKMLVAWRDRTTRHTSAYIDDEEWKTRIRNSGEQQLTILKQGFWDKSRWGDILATSTGFANDSELISDAGRTELLQIAKSVISFADAEASAHLCMLGESLVILPTSLESGLNSDKMLLMIEQFNLMGLKSIRVSLTDNSLR